MKIMGDKYTINLLRDGKIEQMSVTADYLAVLADGRIQFSSTEEETEVIFGKNRWASVIFGEMQVDEQRLKITVDGEDYWVDNLSVDSSNSALVLRQVDYVENNGQIEGRPLFLKVISGQHWSNLHSDSPLTE